MALPETIETLTPTATRLHDTSRSALPGCDWSGWHSTRVASRRGALDSTAALRDRQQRWALPQGPFAGADVARPAGPSAGDQRRMMAPALTSASEKGTTSAPLAPSVDLALCDDAGLGDAPRRGVTESDGAVCWRRHSLQARRDERNRGRTTASTIGIAWKASCGSATPRHWIATKSMPCRVRGCGTLPRAILCAAYKIGQVRPAIGRPLLCCSGHPTWWLLPRSPTRKQPPISVVRAASVRRAGEHLRRAAQRSSAALAGIIGARRECTALTISLGSIPCK